MSSKRIWQVGVCRIPFEPEPVRPQFMKNQDYGLLVQSGPFSVKDIIYVYFLYLKY